MKHAGSAPQAGQTITVDMHGFRGMNQVEYEVEDWWDHLTGKSWMDSDGNPAALQYAVRSGAAGNPINDEVLYGKINYIGYLVHVSDIVKDGE